MSTSAPKTTLESALGTLPSELQKRIVKAYGDLKTQSLEGQFDSIGTRAGRLAEVLLRVLQHLLTGSFTPLSQQLPNFKLECERLEKLPASAGPDGLRILMPRALSFLYTIRNKRDCGHTGGEVDANEIDAATSVRLADWCLCELIRVSHRLPLEEAQDICDAIAARRVPIIWNVLGRKRVLDTSLSYSEQVLLLLYSELENGVPIEDLFKWTEHPHSSNFRRDVLSRLHAARQIEWDRDTDMALISPLGTEAVEASLAPRLDKAR
ncbi:MAG TPA: hypothetical protein VFB36_00845 [Nevskiaceae bacterium]|nr:hypothetical protein [Nevskiaceae bacterium]